MVISDYYRDLSKEDKATLRNKIISEIGFSLPTFHYKVRNNSFRPLELKVVEHIIKGSKMLEKTEFYNCPDGSINVKPYDKPMFVYDQSCRKITEEMLILIRDLYPGAFSALSELYSRSERNREFFEFRIVHRFIRCNFGEYDALSFDISGSGDFNFEDVRCPMRGECLFEGIICKPVLQTRLSVREMEVASLLSDGMCPAEISEELQISILTVRNHIQHIKARLHLKNTSQIISRFKNKK